MGVFGGCRVRRGGNSGGVGVGVGFGGGKGRGRSRSGDEVRLLREIEADEHAVVFWAPACGEGVQVELFGGGEEGKGMVQRARGGGYDRLGGL